MTRALSFRKTHSIHPLFLALFALTLLTLATPLLAASPVDVTVTVFPGDEYAEHSLPPGMTLGDYYGPFHGELIGVPGAVRFEPDDTFWDVGSDITHIQSMRSATLLRIRWVMGETAHDGPVAAMSDPGYGQWVPWELIDFPENEIEVVPGLLGEGAYKLNYDPAFLQTLRVLVQDPAGSGDSTTTTSDFQVVIDDIGVNLNRLLNEVAIFYTITEDGIDIVQLEARWNGLIQSWQIRPTTDEILSTPWANIDREINQIRMIRWSFGLQSGVRLFVNDSMTHALATPGHILNSPEEHELLMTNYSTDATNLQLQFEDPVIHTSGTMDEATTPTVEEFFDDGLEGWSNMGNLAALDTEPQSLPGFGEQFVVDLDWMNPQQSAYLQQGTLRQVGGEPDGHGFRFWMDPTELTLAQDTSLALMLGCASKGPCSQLRTRIDQTANGFRLVTTVDNGKGGIAAIQHPIDNKEHLVEVRFRNAATENTDDGWVELYVNGDLAGRVDGLENYAEPIQLIRLGGLSVPSGASGEIAFDAFEHWQFD